MRQHSVENIENKKSQKLAKHYTIIVNGKKQKILNYQIKTAKSDNKVKTLELISKYKFANNLNSDKPISVIIDNDEKLYFEGTFLFGASAIGNYSLVIKLKS